MMGCGLRVVFLFLFTTFSYGVSITGVGYGSDERSSLKESLSDLANKISVVVKSDLTTITHNISKKYSKDSSQKVSLSSHLPIKGYKVKAKQSDLLTKTTVILSTKSSLGIYRVELERLKRNISNALISLKQTKNKDIQYDILHSLLKNIDNFNKHKVVAFLLKGKDLPDIGTTRTAIKLKIQKLENKISSIKIASKVLTRGITKKNIYISAIKINGNPEITQFAKILKDNMKARVDSSKNTLNADYFLRGSYEILKNSIFVSVNLSDSSNVVLKTWSARIGKMAYKDMAYRTKTKTFDESMNDGFIKSGKLFVNIGFKGFDRSDGIDLEKGDKVDIVVKTNKAICYFLLGHTIQKKKKFSYMLEIGSGESPFINQIMGSDVNRNIVIIEDISVEAPFGSESLQIFASLFTKNAKCPLIVPKCELDSDGYCVVSGKPSKVISHTRALNLKKKKFKVEKSEDSVRWDSFDR
jgi:hypothetical protein